MNEDAGISALCLDSGAYALGALTPDEQNTFLLHAQRCPDCQREIGLFAGLLPLLEQYEPVGRKQHPAAPATGADPSRAAAGTSLADAVVAVPPTRPTGLPAWRTRLALTLLAAASVVLAAFLGLNHQGNPSTSAIGAQSSAPRSSPSAEQAVVRTFPNLGAATVQVTVATGPASAAGSSVNVLCSGAVQNARHAAASAALVSLWVRTRNGDQFELTAWTDMQGSTTITGRTPVAPTDIAMFELRDAQGRILSHIAV